MKKLLAILLLFSGVAFGQAVRSSTSLVTDSLGSNPTAPTTGKDRWFTKQGGFYAQTPTTTKRLDTTFTFVDSSRATGTPHTKYHWGKVFGTYITGYSQPDSVIVIRPSLAVTVDSIMVWHNTGTATVNVTRTRGATTVDMLSSNASASTSWTAASGLQNATLQAGDVLVATIRSLTTSQMIVIQVDAHQ